MIAVATKKISTFNCCESGGTSKDAPVMGAEQQPPVITKKIVIGKNIHSFEYDKEKQPRGGVAYDKAKETKALRILRFAASI